MTNLDGSRILTEWSIADTRASLSYFEVCAGYDGIAAIFPDSSGRLDTDDSVRTVNDESRTRLDTDDSVRTVNDESRTESWECSGSKSEYIVLMD